MISNVSNSAEIQHTAQAEQVKTNKAQAAQEDTKKTHAKPKPPTDDTVKVSSAALAALQEATENTVQTDKEARAGDRQAQQILAKEAAAKAPKK